MTRAVVLLSGGLDSSTCLAIAAEERHRLYALTFDYGQRHRRELAAAAAVASHVGVAEHKVLTIDLRQIGGSALTGAQAVPEGRTAAEIGRGIPATYVPFRNAILLSFAAAYAEVVGAERIYFGANHLDSSGYPDCRPAFVDAFNRLALLGSKAGTEGHPPVVVAPLLEMDKAAIVRTGARLQLPWELTWSCYLGGDVACGRCDSCQLRLRGFEQAGYRDPLPYA